MSDKPHETAPMPADHQDGQSGIIGDVNRSLFAVFRHLLPGVYIVGAAFAAHPSWFASVEPKAWEHIAIAATVALAAGNIWFSVNRYGVHQFIDYLLYLANSPGPVPSSRKRRYLHDLGEYVALSMNAPGLPPLARQHVAFRASAVLLLYTVAEVGLLFAGWHEPGTVFSAYQKPILGASLLVFVVGLWQNVITRRIDYYIINSSREPPRDRA
jgi:hypothetical protein